MKKILKILKILNFLLVISILLGNYVQAFSLDTLTGTPVTVSRASNLGNQIITVLTIVGTVLSVVVLIVLGLKYMLGSVEEKAEYKKTLIPYVIGAALVFAASSIAGVLYNVGQNIGE